MSRTFSLPSVAALFGASAAASAITPPAPTVPAVPASTAAGPDAAAVEAAVAADLETHVSAAVAGERSRWASVLSSPEGKANLAGAVGMLAKSPMSGDDIVATLKDMGPAASTASEPGGGTPSRVETRLGELDKGAAAPKTGTGPQANGDGTGTSEPDPTELVRKQREERKAAALKKAEAGGHRLANA